MLLLLVSLFFFLENKADDDGENLGQWVQIDADQGCLMRVVVRTSSGANGRAWPRCHAVLIINGVETTTPYQLYYST